MKYGNALLKCLLVIGLISFGYSRTGLGQSKLGWTTLFDGSSLDGWNTIGTANWKLADGIVQADKGNGYLVSKNSYGNFQLRVEFWVNADTNSGVFIRCTDPQKIGTDNAYEVNIFDNRPDPSYRTGAITNLAKPEHVVNAADQWNTFEISAQGNHLTVSMNGVRTVDIEDGKFSRGYIGLQYSSGIAKFRKVQIKPMD